MNRRALVTVCALVCLLVATSLVVTAAQSTLRTKRELFIRQQLRQTDLLLDAAIELARQRIQLSPGYTGETWRPGESLSHYFDPQVKITVTRNEDATTVELTASVADIPPISDLAIGFVTRRSHQLIIKNTPSTNSEL